MAEKDSGIMDGATVDKQACARVVAEKYLCTLAFVVTADGILI
jgi:hypothetical protein